MKSIDWQKGGFRLTLVVSILLGLLGLCVGIFGGPAGDIAVQITLGQVAGKVVETEREMESGVDMCDIEIKTDSRAKALFVIIPFGLVWLVYFVIIFIVKGFTDKN